MATITAKGKTDFGYKEITITGSEKVAEIVCADSSFMRFIEISIKNAVGTMANNYKPPANTMLQAYLTLLTVFEREQDITVDGDIGTAPTEPGKIY